MFKTPVFAAPVFKALKGKPGDLLGIARTPNGNFVVEKNTDEVKAIHEHFFPSKPKEKTSGTSGATVSLGGAPKRQARTKKKPSSTTVTTTEDYGDDDIDMYGAEEPIIPTKRRRIGGSSGPTKRILATSAVAGGGGGATSRQKYLQTQRLMVPLTRPSHDPMPLLPGEAPLGIETFFGEGSYSTMVPGSTTTGAELGSETAAAVLPAECLAQPPARYRHAVTRARDGMKKKALTKGGKALVLRAIKAVELFERICLGDDIFSDDGKTILTAADRKAACIEYDAVLREIYPDLILDAHVLDVQILENFESTEELQLLRCMERRFIIWKQNKETALHQQQHQGQQQDEHQHQAVEPSSRPNSRTEELLSTIGSSLQWMKERIPTLSTSAGAGVAALNNQESTLPYTAEAVEAVEGTGAGVPCVHNVDQQQQQQNGRLTRWGDGLKLIWKAFSSRVGEKQYGGVDLRTTDANVSCALNDTIWWNGQLVRRPLPSNQPVLATIADAIAGTRDGNPRLYLTDGSMPDYEAQSYPLAAPGMPCYVDALSNAMLPHAVRSSRSTNLFHFLKNESTGTGTFTLFCGVGPGANLTAFHYETKRRRSYNCATGDYIFQPLAAVANTRAMMRVHAAVAGRHSRHGQLLPLECYLEEGITMVTHLRTDPDPSLCELCEQSMHAFVTFDDGTCASPASTATTTATVNGIAADGCGNKPIGNNTININGTNNETNNNERMLPLKVSCNDFDVIWDVDATYYMERVSKAYQYVGIMPEEAPPLDGADTWIQSSYLTAEPRTLKNTIGWGGGAKNSSSNNNNNSIRDSFVVRPWACEVTSAARKEINSPGWKPDLRGQKREIGDGELESDMDVIVLRTAEKLLDVILKKVSSDVVQSWVGEVPLVDEAKEGLKRLVPVINDMLTRALSENDDDVGGKINFDTSNGGGAGGAEQQILIADACHFSREYLDDLLQKISHADAVQDTGLNISNISETTYSLVFAHMFPDIFESESAEELGNLPAGMLRKCWMHRLVEERKAVLAQPLSLEAVAASRRQRHAAEAAFDIACCELIERNSRKWGIDMCPELQPIEIE